MIRGLLSLYAPAYPMRLLQLFAAQDYHAWSYLKSYWRAQDFSKPTTASRPVPGWAIAVLYAGVILHIAAGVAIIIIGQSREWPAGWQFGAALIVAYPIVWAHMLVLPTLVYRLLHPKALGKAVLCHMLASQVVRLRRRHTIKVVAVAGSVGKTSTKLAIANLLAATQKVRFQEGNYNDPVTVPLIFFGHTEPNIFNVFAWLCIMLDNERQISGSYPYEYVVAELGTDTPGTIPQFAYIRPDVAVVTAVSPEHMEYFGTLEAVAQEELSVLSYAKETLVNIDDTPDMFLTGKTYMSYGLTSKATYYAGKRKSKHWQGQELTFYLGKQHSMEAHISLLGETGAKIALAAAAAAHVLGLSKDDIQAGVGAIAAFAGRMQVLPGIKNSTIIDDTYNASPLAAKAALDVLYAGDAPQRIAILGSMNELGDYSKEAHTEVGNYCDPSKLDWVVTIGPAAKEFLAPAAAAQGCQVKVFLDPYKAGAFVRKKLEEGAVVLAKGSQNRVFAEEALKVLLADPGDQAKLTRQSPHWMAIKAKQFKP